MPRVLFSHLTGLMMPVLIACETVFWKFKCPKKWEELSSTDDAKVRYCGSCRERVYFCDDVEELSVKSREGVCVAFFQEDKRDQQIDYSQIPKPVVLGRF